MKASDVLGALDAGERVALATVARLGPWLAPLPPAFFVARATDKRLGTGLPVAVMIAVVVEAAGIAAASATLAAYTWNRERPAKTDPKAPTVLGLVLCAVYLAVGIIISVVLELDGGLAVYVPGLFFALAGQVYAVKAMMSDQVRREQQAKQAKIERSEKRKESIREKKSAGGGVVERVHVGVADDQAATAADFDRALAGLGGSGAGAFGATQLAGAAGLGRTTAYQLIRYGLARGLLRRAGRGQYVYVNDKEE
jgi:hypothetical protein